MFVPKQALIPESTVKHTLRQQNTNIFKDKTVSRVKSPLLNNIEIGLQVTDLTTKGIPTTQRTSAIQPVRRIGALNLLTAINVVRVNIPKEFSLLIDTAAQMTTENKSIFETEIYKNTFNDAVSATDKFANSADPFYVLDGGNLVKSTYNAEKDEKGNVMEQVDLSKIAAGMVSLNVSPQYTGRSKYFTPDIKGDE